MWSKLNNALKLRASTPVNTTEDEHAEAGSGEVMAGVYEQHPNLSVFHQPSEVPFPTPSPPPSPSRNGRKGMFKRMSRQVMPNNDSNEAFSRMSISKKVKPSLHGLTTESLSRATAEASVRQSQDTARPSVDSNTSRPSPSLPPATPVTESRFGSIRSILKPGNTPGTGQTVRFFSRDAYRVISPEQSSSEVEDPNLFHRLQRAAPTRPSGQQLFSTPPPPPPKEASLSPPHEVVPSTSTPMMGQKLIPAPNLGNIFEFSQDVMNEVDSIAPIGSRMPLLDTAVEVTETETETETDGERDDDEQRDDEDDTKIQAAPKPEPRDNSLPIPSQLELGAPFNEVLAESKLPPGIDPISHDRSRSFSFGQTIFQSLKTEDGPNKPLSNALSPLSRSRSVSDTVFTSMIQSPASALAVSKHEQPETDINDTSMAVVAYHPQPQPSPRREPDPFGAHATAYYQPPSPPQSTTTSSIATGGIIGISHTRSGSHASSESDTHVLWSLRTQLALQTELCAQYESDLAARDALVDTLQGQLAVTSGECERRKTASRAWRRRVAELERCIRALEDSVERSREESAERSVMDEASGEALRMLHRRIGELEHERGELERAREVAERRDGEARAALGVKEDELRRMADELRTRDQSERQLKEGIVAAQEQMAQISEHAAATAVQDERARLMSIGPAGWEAERARLVAQGDRWRAEQGALQAVITALREDLVRKEEELNMMKGEIESQWRHTEQAGEELERLKGEKATLIKENEALLRDNEELAKEAESLAKEHEGMAQETEALRSHIAALESERDESEARNMELDGEVEGVWAQKEALEKIKRDLEAQLRSEMEHAAELTRALQEREDKASTLSNEKQFAYDSVSRLQDSLKQRDAEIADLTRHVREREIDAEDARESLTRQRREHARVVDEQSRKLSEVVAREVESRHAMERAVRERAEAEVARDTLQERVTQLTEEVDKLRRQVHDLQQESAEKEIKLVQAAKQRGLDKEDIQGLNIALAAKQQEVEMYKRKSDTRTSIGTSSTAASRAPFRRESSIFGTPSVSRPSSALSDASTTSTRPANAKTRKLSDPSTVKPLARSTRPNATPSAAGAAARKMLDRDNAGSIHPPSAVKLRATSSLSGAPSRLPSSSLARSSSLTPAPRGRPASSLEPLKKNGASARRDSVLSASDVSEQSEKENMNITPLARRSSVAVPA